MLPGRKVKSLTLIELLVTMGIIVLMLSISIPLYIQNARKQDMRAEAELVASFVKRAKNFAQSPENRDATGYRVVVRPGGNGEKTFLDIKRLRGVEEDSLSGEALAISRSSVSLSSGLDFYVFSGEYKGAGAEIRLVSKTQPSKTAEVVITKPGSINVQVP